MRYEKETVVDALRVLAPTVEVARYAIDIIERDTREIVKLKIQRMELMAAIDETKAMLDGAIAAQERLQALITAEGAK